MQVSAELLGGDSFLTDKELAPIVDEAMKRWSEVCEFDEAALASLDEVTFQIVDLDGLNLGQTTGTKVLIDVDAAGHGWFVDATPSENTEFNLHNNNREITATSSSEAYGQMDLLTVVMHELGHMLGFEDLNTEAHTLMSSALDSGNRYLIPVDIANTQIQDSSTTLIAADSTKENSSIQESPVLPINLSNNDSLPSNSSVKGNGKGKKK